MGKGTVITALREKHKNWVFPPSCTTRESRPGEIEGETYFFISKEEFLKRVGRDEFLEHAEVHGGNLYGTLKKPLVTGVEQGKIVIREFDVQGFLQVREKLPKEYYTSIFLKPAEGVEVLGERIRHRAPITDEELVRRMESMKNELKLEHLYDYTVISRQGAIRQMVEDIEHIIVS
ncbi:guanylate kinase [Candidatus Gracilibacteria bacterium]|nr:guanylate kinase [Candidatus Gracilibacteria bacterium]